jgi:hypothetical protein
VDWPGNITAVGGLVTAVGAIVIALRRTNGVKSAADAVAAAAATIEESKAEIIATKAGVFEVGERIDGRLTQLLEETRANARAEGKVLGRDEERAEVEARRKAEGQG